MVFGDWLRRVRSARPWSAWKRHSPRRRAPTAAVEIETLQARQMLTTQIDILDVSVQETDGFGDVTVNVSGDPLENDLTLTYTVTSTSAENGTDFSLADGTLVIYAGTTSGTISFSLMDDAENEAGEDFEVTLTSASEGDIVDGVATVVIADDDSLVEVQIQSTTVTEPDGMGAIVLQASAPGSGNSLTNDLIVSYTVTSGSAIEGTDFSLSSGTVTIPSGSNEAPLWFSVTNDLDVEGAEGFTVEITSVSYGTIATGTASVSITDDDVPIEVQVQSGSASEADGTGTVNFQASSPESSDPLNTDLIVTYTVTSGSATEGVDFFLSGGSMTIPAGSNEASVPFSITNDTDTEGGESFTVEITSVSYGTIANGTATVSITDDDVVIEVQVQSGSASEGQEEDGTVTFHASAPGSSDPLTTDLTVTYTVISGTATEGEDFSMSGGSVTIPAGSNEASVSFSVTDDTDIEGGESFTVEITSVSYGTITSATATVGIADNDGGPVILPNQLFVVAENSPPAFVVGTVQATTNLPGGTLQNWTLDDDVFEIDASTGVISVHDFWLLDFELLLSLGKLDENFNYSVTVTVSDGTLTFLPEIVLINVLDLDEFSLPSNTDGFLPTDHPQYFQEHGLPIPDPRAAIQEHLLLQEPSYALIALPSAGHLRDFNGQGVGTDSWSHDETAIPGSVTQVRNYAVPGALATVTVKVDYWANATATNNVALDWTYLEEVSASFLARTDLDYIDPTVTDGWFEQAGTLYFKYDGRSITDGYTFTEDIRLDVNLTAGGGRYEQTRSGNWFSNEGERDKRIESYTVSVNGIPAVSEDHYEALETTTVTTANGANILYDIRLDGSGWGNWDETRTNGQTETWVDVDDWSAGDGSKDHVTETYNRSLHNDYWYDFDYDFTATQSDVSSTAYYGAPLPADGTIGTRFDRGFSNSTATDTAAGTESREFYSIQQEAGPSPAPAWKSPDDIFPRKTTIELTSSRNFQTSSSSTSSFKQTFDISPSSISVSLLSQGQGGTTESITGGNKTETTNVEAGLVGSTNFVKNYDKRETQYNSD